MKKRLQLILSHAGIASRRHSADVIQEGRVKVDGKVVVDKGLQFDPDTNVIEVDGRR
ncbi:MAG TPA: S4 domain-containing protein, partial [Candidatus Omnitrophota bacterium]|nr:S4 domain-containing protein [Candidatus Omnitrophota bacterium]